VLEGGFGRVVAEQADRRKIGRGRNYVDEPPSRALAASVERIGRALSHFEQDAQILCHHNRQRKFISHARLCDYLIAWRAVAVLGRWSAESCGSANLNTDSTGSDSANSSVVRRSASQRPTQFVVSRPR
jgi:hypothetical protein